MKKPLRIIVIILILAVVGITFWKFEEFLQFFEGPEKLFIFLFMIFTLVVKQIIISTKGEEMWRAIRGDDNKLQLHEIVGLLWILNFDIMLYMELFFQRKASENMWYSMDLIFAIIILGDTGNNFIKTKFNQNDTKKNSTPG